MTTSVVVDLAKMALLKAAPSIRQAEYWAEILCKGDFVITGTTNRSYSRFSEPELRQLTGFQGHCTYGELVGYAAQAAAALPVDETPLDALQARLPRQRIATQEGDIPAALLPPALAQSAATGKPWEAAKPTPPFLREPKAPGPPAKGATARVWAICDAKAAVMNPVSSQFRDICKGTAETEGINPSTFGVQFGKWKKARNL